MDRRSMLTLLALAGVAACSSPTPTKGDDVEVIRYGDDESQVAELSRPTGRSKGVVVIIHGGFWRAQYDLSLGRPLAESLVEEGWTAYNLEYRRVGNGGGWPTTFDDVAAGIDALAGVDGLDLAKVTTLGHSAGGHLAVWAAARPSLTGSPWADPAVTVTAAIAQAGVLDLEGATAANLGGGAAQAFMEGEVDDRYLLADPIRQVPLDVPVRCVHGTADQVVPIEQSLRYVEQATAAGGDAELVEVEGDHFTVIDPSTSAWRRTLETLAAL